MSTTTAGRPGGRRRRTVRQWAAAAAAAAAAAGRGLLADRLGRSTDRRAEYGTFAPTTRSPGHPLPPYLTPILTYPKP